MMTINDIKVSIGSASVLGLYSKTFKDPPTTCYLMTYKKGQCDANCGFCPQSSESKSSAEMLSRIHWPIFPFNEFLSKLELISPLNKFKRICLQTLNYSKNFQEVVEIITQIKKISNIPISISIQPLSKEELMELKSIGVQRISIALDGATPKIFEDIKGKGVNGPYNWDHHFQSLTDAIAIFSKGFVSTHLIVGLGETQKDFLKQVEQLHKLTILPSIFAFAPIKGTKFENLNQPNLIDFRKIQLGRYLILHKEKEINDFKFNSKGDIIHFGINKIALRKIIKKNQAFMTSGCNGCNRPYYTSRPSGPIFNYPRELNESEKNDIYNLLKKFVN